MGWQFRGQANVEALLRTIAAEPLSVVLTSRIHFANHTHEDVTETYTTQPLAAGSRLLFAGCSAGARGAMFTADFIAPMLPAGVTVHAFFDSPMWIDVPPLPGVNVTSLEAETQAVFGLVNASARLDPACVATYPGNNSWKCLYGQYRIPFVKTPYLLSMSQIDAFQLPYNEGGKPPYIGAAGAYADEFQVAMRDVALQLPTSQQAGSAVFSSACFKHCVCTIGAFWGVKVNGKSLSHYLGAWYLGTNMECRVGRHRRYLQLQPPGVACCLQASALSGLKPAMASAQASTAAVSAIRARQNARLPYRPRTQGGSRCRQLKRARGGRRCWRGEQGAKGVCTSRQGASS